MRRCVRAVICSFSASVHLPGPQALEVRKSRRPHSVLETVTRGEEAELSGWRREWPQIIPSFPSIPHSHGGCNAKGEIPREWKVGDTDRAIYPTRESSRAGPAGSVRCCFRNKHKLPLPGPTDAGCGESPSSSLLPITFLGERHEQELSLWWILPAVFIFSSSM